ncbi:hypothetical protein M407DRAFT_31419 [Tulasnella calospora MUT 4182]|uniref:Protein kinase domain-containing protein n=1 Tax=Tulasnella calospora MUT 4182 TaxID=1051891 RepID=A0A0C3PVE2_9AGAM|nr:hypothetical protein M407DRAFT_31419 [Tulasnella calospora MUT 4182]
MPHLLTFNPQVLAFREPSNQVKRKKLEICGDSAAHVVFRTSFIATRGLRFVCKNEVGFVPAQCTSSLTIRPPENKLQVPGTHQYLCIESLETPEELVEDPTLTWNNLRRTGTHITSWIIPIVIHHRNGVIEAEPTPPTTTLLPHRAGGPPLKAGEAATLNGVVKKLQPQVIALYDKAFASNSRGTVQEGVMRHLEPSEKQEKVAIKYVMDYNNNGGRGESTPRSLIERTQTELFVWLRLNHINIAPLLGYAIHPRTFFISPFYPNGNVFEFVRRPLTKGRTRLKLIQQTASALEYIHRQGYIHGDLKRDNVMVDLHERAIIIDFGFSLSMSVAIEHITTVGHQNYQPREVYYTLRKTWRSDVYAFALLTLEASGVALISTGVKAFEKLGPVLGTYAASEHIQQRHYPQLNSESPLWEIMECCWHLDPMQRPSMWDTKQKLQFLQPNHVQNPM